MKKRLIILVIIFYLAGLSLFAGGVNEDTTYARTILERKDSVSTYFQQVVEPLSMKNGPLHLTAVPLLSETYVLSQFPDMKNKRYNTSQMESKLRVQTKLLDRQQEMGGTFLIILRYEKDEEFISLSSFTIDPSFFEYMFLDNDKDDFLRVSNHSVLRAKKVDANNKVLEFWVTFGGNEEEREKFFQESKTIAISVTDFGFEGQLISYELPISKLFSNMPKEPKGQLEAIRASRGVGDIGPAGGEIFYDKGNYSDGWRYLEAAAAGWSETSYDPSYVFGYYRPADDGTDQVVGTGTAIGTGEANTKALVSKMGNTAYNDYMRRTTKAMYAAKVCADYRGGGYDDWFLPSKDELDLMYQYLQMNNLAGLSGGRSYWSSSEYDGGSAWYLYFYKGNQSYSMRANENTVRPVRAF